MFGSAIAISRLLIRTTPNCAIFAFSKTFKQCFSQEVSHCRLRQLTLGVRSFSNWRTFIPNKSWRKDTLGWNHHIRRMLMVLPNNSKVIRNSTMKKITNPLETKTNIKNNVILYRFEKPYMYKCGMIFAGAALIGCLTMADSVYLILCKDLFKPGQELWTRIVAHIFPLIIICIGILAGPSIFLMVWYITKRTVKYIILHKGGKVVTLITYHPFKGEIKMTVPIINISCSHGRHASKGYLPIKIRNTKLHYMMDKAGHFVNPELFDVTVGVERF